MSSFYLKKENCRVKCLETTVLVIPKMKKIMKTISLNEKH